MLPTPSQLEVPRVEVWQGRADHTDLLAPLEGWQEDGGDVGGGDVPLSGVQGALHPVAVHRPHHLRQGGRGGKVAGNRGEW